ncbi:hypothetical protein [Roseivirga pacifica]|uniref:hypothetical protein n=1 Tax=Roseivirga pacifica TaxID=1267423 RepID=UPI002094D379|nr:hypothetical protein [Roseivirga pacifica]MCO6360828.1 hypothetical protein [Roseivirga pacifica]MCO6368717.1 hypothetical protein [Roseivirga pacifica]MCO6372860.1 hypothetical protein [Roseivirga pacifica]MCO6376919.1 hypothetical protein [Roseivirga pacifica]MCO6377803.1 hypothetical protein [Roseivirga pacifica]
MKNILSIILLTIVVQSYSQTVMRNVSWGMSKSEVRAVEKDGTLDDTRYSNGLLYQGVTTSTGNTGRLIYLFDNNDELNRILLTIYGKDTPEELGTCKNIVPTFNKIKATRSLFNDIMDQGYSCKGWLLNDYGAGDFKFPMGDANCTLDKSSADKMDTYDIKDWDRRIDYTNETTNLLIYFHKMDNYWDLGELPCNEKKYNELLVLNYNRKK